MVDYVPVLDSSGTVAKMAATKRAADDRWTPVHQSLIMPIQATLTRPANATPFTAGDVEGDVGASDFYSFDLAAYGVKSGLIVGARMIRQSLNNSTVKRRVLIHDAALAIAPADDNAPFPLLWANRASRRGWIDFRGGPLPTSEFGTGTDCLEWAGSLSNVQGIPVAPADGIVRGWCVTVDTYTPGEVSTVSVLELDLVI